MTLKKIRVLSIDGGGIRGILPGQILLGLEKKLKLKTNNPQAKIGDFFDLIAGTSTGGILTCLYLFPDENDPSKAKFSAQDAVNLYIEHGDKIFDIPFWHRIRSSGGVAEEKYPAKNLENLLKQYFGEHTLKELIKPCLITSYDIERRKAHFFTQHDAIQRESYDFLIRDVARATSAAPTFFEPAMIHSLTEVGYPLVDGGVFANNPSLCAYAELKSLEFKEERKKLSPEDILFLSIGTGSVEKKYEYSKAKDWGLVGWIKPVLDIIMSGVAETVDYQLRQIFEGSGISQQYLRIEPELFDASSEMDDAQEKNLIALREAGIENAQNHDNELDRWAELLIQ